MQSYLTCDPSMSMEAAMSNEPRTVASLECVTILFILKGDRRLRISSAPTRPLFPCSPGDILNIDGFCSLAGERVGQSVSQSEEDFHAILQANRHFATPLLLHEVCLPRVT